MAIHKSLLLALAFVAAGVQGVNIPVHRKQVDSAYVRPRLGLARRQTGAEPNREHKDHYWFGNYTVGDTKNLDLLIDTGSPFVIVNPGLYKASANAIPVPRNQTNFNLTYEGVNKEGTGFETVYVKVKRDTVSAGNLSAPGQGIGNVTHYNTSGTEPLKTALPGDGVIGFSYTANDTQTGLPLFPSWVSNLCHQKLISACRFALAYGTNNKGVQIVGEVDKTLFKEKQLTTTPVHVDNEYGGWTIQGDVSLNELHFPNQTIIMDSGTNNMQAPLPVARKIFKTLGYQTVTTHVDSRTSFITAYYPCTSPPNLTFSFPAKADLQKRVPGIQYSKTAQVFELLSSEWLFTKNANNNCTAVLVGTNALTDPANNVAAWLVGQPFYQGHYIDHQLNNPAVGFATLVNPGNVAGSG